MPLPAPAVILQSASRPVLTLFHPGPPVVTSERILRIQGYTDLTRVRPVIRLAAEAMAQAAMTLSKPSVASRHVRVQAIRGEVLELDGGESLNCRVFSRTLSGCTEIVPFVLTVGSALDERVMGLAEAGDLLEAVLLEAAGWLSIEDATRQFKVHLREEAMRHGHRITSRMGPGYSYKVDGETCMWPLEDQVTLFGLLGESGRLPVTLMRSCAMLPKLSRSGMFGLAPLQPAVPEIHIHTQERMQ